jgi:hypothetical protein
MSVHVPMRREGVSNMHAKSIYSAIGVQQGGGYSIGTHAHYMLEGSSNKKEEVIRTCACYVYMCM